MTKQTQLLQTIIDEIRKVQAMDVVAFNAYANQFRPPILPSIPFPDGSVASITREGSEAVQQLLQIVWAENSDLHHTVSRKGFHDIALRVLGKRLNKLYIKSTLNEQDRHDLTMEMVQAAESNRQEITHFVPCEIFNDPGPDFEVGPITFRTVQNWLPSLEARAIKPQSRQAVQKLTKLMVGNPIWSMLDRLQFRWLNSRLARFLPVWKNRDSTAPLWKAGLKDYRWIGEVTTTQHEANLGRARAEVAVDAALTGLRLCLGQSNNRGVATASSRLRARYSVSIRLLANGAISHGSATHNWAALGGDGAPEKLVNDCREFLDAVGERLQSFLHPDDIKYKIRKLDRRWIEAAYWYSQAVTETVDTIAIVKLETAVEVLLEAESSSGSKARMARVFVDMFGHPLSQPVSKAPGDMTAQQFCTWLVGQRSRVIHGTLDTLLVDVENDRRRAEFFVEDTLFEAALKLSEYSRSTNPIDSVDGFLNWMKAERAVAAPNAASTGGVTAGVPGQSSLGQAGPSGQSNQQHSTGGGGRQSSNPTGQGSP